MSTTASFPLPEDHSDTVDFLRRLAGVISGGQYAGKLLDAAAAIESLTSQLELAAQLWREERDECAKNLELRHTAEVAVGKLTSGVIALNAELAESAQQSKLERDQFAKETHRLLALAENAEAQLASTNTELARLRSSLAALGDTLVVVPIQPLRAARAQFDDLAEKFARNGDVISRAVCEIGGYAIDQALTHGFPGADVH